MQKAVFALIIVTFLLILFNAWLNFHIDYNIQAQNSSNTQNKTFQVFIPATISEEAQEKLRNLYIHPFEFKSPVPKDLEGWIKFYDEVESNNLRLSESIRDLYEPSITEALLGGINVLDIKPKNWVDNDKVLVYTHGGSYRLLTADSSLFNSVLAANSTGLRVISVNYTVAPFSKWNQTTDEVISVIQALRKEEGYSPKDIAIYGDSSGGGLAAGSILKMRDKGMGMPAALVLWSPLADLTLSGDTYFTLADADLYLKYGPYFQYPSDAYADTEDKKNPYVSPVYGNFTKGFPPTLIQGGTKEYLLSDFVRLYQALDQADVKVILDIYEGMPHVFQSLLTNTPESDIALSKMNDFLRQHLDY